MCSGGKPVDCVLVALSTTVGAWSGMSTSMFRRRQAVEVVDGYQHATDKFSTVLINESWDSVDGCFLG